MIEKIFKKRYMETITNGDARRIFDNIKKFYNAFRKINGVKIYQKIAPPGVREERKGK